MPYRVPEVVPVALLAVGVALLFPAGAGAYINAGFRSREEYWEYLKQRGLLHLEAPGAGSAPNVKPLATPRDKAWEHAAKGEWEQALRCYDEAIAGATSDAVRGPLMMPRLYYERGDACWQTRDYARALADYRMAVKQTELLAEKGLQEPLQDRKAYLRLAVAYAACPDPALRDRAKSITMAEKACALVDGYDNYAPVECQSILAALHAAAGDFDAAIRVQTRLVNRVGASEWEPITKLHLQQYQQGKMVWAFPPDLTGPADPRPRKAER